VFEPLADLVAAEIEYRRANPANVIAFALSTNDPLVLMRRRVRAIMEAERTEPCS
jgi:hypothetical protein